MVVTSQSLALELGVEVIQHVAVERAKVMRRGLNEAVEDIQESEGLAVAVEADWMFGPVSECARRRSIRAIKRSSVRPQPEYGVRLRWLGLMGTRVGAYS